MHRPALFRVFIEFIRGCEPYWVRVCGTLFSLFISLFSLFVSLLSLFVSQTIRPARSYPQPAIQPHGPARIGYSPKTI